MSRQVNTKTIVQDIKDFHHTYGAKGCGELFRAILREDRSVADMVLFLIDVVYKIETCTSDCWDDLENKKFFACECNDDPILIPLDDYQEVAES